MKSSILHRIGFYLILFLVSVFPLFFLPITSEFYEFNKNYLLITVSIALLAIWVFGFIADRQVRITRSPLGLPVLALLTAWIISTVGRTPNRLDAIIDPGQTGTFVALAIYFFTGITYLRSKKHLDLIVFGIIGSFSLLAVSSLLWGSGIMEKAIPWAFAKFSLWTPAGGSLTTLVALVTMIPFTGIIIFKQKDSSNRILLLSIALFLFVAATGVTAYRLFADPNNRPIFLSQSTGWVIAMEALKSSPLMGTGAGTYLIDFTRFRPISFNLSPYWNIRFNSASNYYLQTLTTLGLLGLSALIFLAVKVGSLCIKSIRSASGENTHTVAMAASVTALLLLISFFFIPPGLVNLFFFFTLLVTATGAFKLMGSSLVHEANIDIIAASDTGIRTPILPWIALIASIALVVTYGTTLAKAYYAETLFQQSLVAAAKNDGRTTYQKLNEAIRLNSYRDTYRVVASQTYLLLANSTASKENLTAEDRTTITDLIQLSIQEAKNAVALNPTKAGNLENLAGIYQNLLNFAEGADQWSVASYQQAIALDPVNPRLRVSLGGIFFARKNYDESLRLFLQAADLKPDFANAFYNISATYKEKKDYQNAYLAMQQVVNLVDKTSADYLKAKDELEALGKLVGTTSQIPAEPAKSELETAKPLPTPKVNPPISLPSELGPETTPVPTSAPTTTP